MKYFISDNHWGHGNIINIANRPFNDVNEMNQYMIDQWNSVVGENDEVYYLGDLMYRMNPKHFVKYILSKLNGKKYLIPGNHDKRYMKHYIEHFEWINEIEYLTHSVNNETYNFVLFHYPIISWDGMFRNHIHLHGHTHNNSIEDKMNYNIIGHILNVNCEFNDYKPLSINDIIERFKNKKINL